MGTDATMTGPVSRLGGAARLHPHHHRRGRAGGEARRTCGHAVSARAERLPAHRPRQVDLPELRRRRASSAAPATCASTTPTRPRKTSSTSTRSRKTSAGWASTGGEPLYASDYFEKLYDYAVHLIEHGKAYVDSLTADEMREYRGTLTEPGTDSPYRDRLGRGEPRSVRARCGPASSPTARTSCARRSTWRRRTSTCAIRCSTGSGARTTTAPATRGASIRCTTSRTRRRTRSRRSRTRSARSSSRITGRSTTG